MINVSQKTHLSLQTSELTVFLLLSPSLPSCASQRHDDVTEQYTFQ